MLLAEIAISARDWMGLAALVLGQTAALGSILWKFASRLQKLESNLENLSHNVTSDHSRRIARLEDLSFKSRVSESD